MRNLKQKFMLALMLLLAVPFIANAEYEEVWLHSAMESGNWKLEKRVTEVYHENGNILSETIETNSSGSLNFTERTIYEYNAAGNVIKETDEEFSSEKWKEYARLEIKYDANGNKIEETYFEDIGSGIAPLEIIEFEYRGGNLATETTSYFESGVKIPSERSKYSYDSEGHLTEELIQEYYGSWMDYEKIVHEIDPETGFTVKSVYWEYDEDDWYEYGIETITYDDNGMITSFSEQYYDGLDWINFSKSILVWEGKKLLSWTNQIWAMTDWVNFDRTDINYDENGNEISYIISDWEGSDWTPTKRAVLDGVSPVAQQQIAETRIYPNPANDIITLSRSQVESKERFTILDLNGNKQMQFEMQAGNYQKQLLIDQLPSGTYMIISNSGGVASKCRFVIAR